MFNKKRNSYLKVSFDEGERQKDLIAFLPALDILIVIYVAVDAVVAGGAVLLLL